MKSGNRLSVSRGEEGTSLVELAILAPMFLLLLVGAIDFGRAYYLSVELAGAAHAAALYGSENPTDTAGMKTTAEDDAPDVPDLSVGTPTYGCECADGSGYSANCQTAPTCASNNEVYRVNVTVTATYNTLLPWPGIPSSMSFSSTASIRSAGS
jgi:Flp pilus assembly protein TadG